jgi:hypothetical protein
LGIQDFDNPDDEYAMMVVKAKEGSDALASPTGYDDIWWFIKDSIYYEPPNPFPFHVDDTTAVFWRPIPPDGYKALGSIVSAGTQPPDLSSYVCVREDLTKPGTPGSGIWTNAHYYYGNPSYTGVACYMIEPPSTPTEFPENARLHTGTMLAWEEWRSPLPGDEDDYPSLQVMNVLNVELPMLAEAPYQTYVPQLESYDTPPEETVPLLGKAMLVPCTIVNDKDYVNNVHWRVANSPFYRLERQVFYKRLYHNYNQTSEVQTNEVSMTCGVSSEKTNEIHSETSIEVSMEAGVSIEWFSGKISTTVSKSMGYSTQNAIGEFTEQTISTSINTPPGKAAALWQKYNRFVLKRHNGTDLEQVYAWVVGIESYVVDEYPDEE